MRAVLLLLALTACNTVFGIEQTEPAPTTAADFDEDGVSDSEDNCATVVNPDQVNGDGDAFGDACDTCPKLASASTHDEDGDRIGDDCDVCPGVPDFQDDTDGDGVGDVCDPSPTAPTSHRIHFEPFTELGPDWTFQSPWELTDDAAGPTMMPVAGDTGLTRVTPLPPAYELQIGFRADTHWRLGERFGLEVTTSSGIQPAAYCRITCVETGCSGSFLVNNPVTTTSSSLPSVPLLRMRFDIRAPSGGCLYDLLGGTASTSLTSGTLHLLATPNIRVAYIDVLQ